MFTIKICGITRPEDAEAAAAAGADAIGLNFYPMSPRVIDVARAREIIATLPPGIVKVGVFVNAPVKEVCRIYDDLGLDLIQLHGDEPPEYVAQLGGRPVMKAFRTDAEDGLLSIVGYFVICRELSCMPRMILLDAFTKKAFGGTGKLADWSLAKKYAARASLPPLVLAGGLRLENVAEAIRATGATAIDTASGVESQPGIKDATLLTSFVRAARSAWNNAHYGAGPLGGSPSSA
jgi:phosphoribosylanthranilate isomerase